MVADDELIDRYIGRDPNGRGAAEARLKRYGVSVWAIIGQLFAEDGDIEETARAYDVPIEAVEAALVYYHRHRTLIHARLAANLDDDEEMPPRFLTAGGIVDRVHVSFSLNGDALDPIHVTSVMGIEPDHAHAAGDLNPRTKRNPVRFPSGQWRLESTLPRTRPLEEHLHELLGRLDGRSTKVRALVDEGLRAWFHVGLFLDAWNRGAGISAEMLRQIGELGADLDLDIYHT